MDPKHMITYEWRSMTGFQAQKPYRSKLVPAKPNIMCYYYVCCSYATPIPAKWTKFDLRNILLSQCWLTTFLHQWTKYDQCYQILIQLFINRWLSVVDDRPGICKNAILELGRKRNSLGGEKYKNCTLVVDAMGIKQQIMYSQKEKKLVGKQK